jgi:hypothetical protein
VSQTRPPLHSLALACHAALALAAGALADSAAGGALAGAALAAVAAAPLVATLPGLARTPRMRTWVALLLVLYTGATSVEVVASAGSAKLASVALLIAVLELAVLLALSRGSRAPPPAARG